MSLPSTAVALSAAFSFGVWHFWLLPLLTQKVSTVGVRVCRVSLAPNYSLPVW